MKKNIFLKIIVILALINVQTSILFGMEREDTSINQLFSAISKNDVNTVQQLIRREPYLKGIVDDQGNTLIHLAVSQNSIPLVRFFIQEKLSINIQNSLGESPLCIAARKGYVDLIEQLIHNQAEIDPQNSQYTPLDYAIMHSQVESVRALLKIAAPVMLPGQALPQSHVLAHKLPDGQAKSAIVGLLINAQARRLMEQINRASESVPQYAQAFQQSQTIPSSSTGPSNIFRKPALPAQPSIHQTAGVTRPVGPILPRGAKRPSVLHRSWLP